MMARIRILIDFDNRGREISPGAAALVFGRLIARARALNLDTRGCWLKNDAASSRRHFMRELSDMHVFRLDTAHGEFAG